MLGRLGLLAFLFGVAACGKSVSFDKPDAKGSSDGGGGGSDAAPGWTSLITLPWSLTAGEQTYECEVVQVPTDMYINAWSSIAPTGTHHQVLTVVPNANGMTLGSAYSCTGQDGTLDGEMLFAAGVGTGELTFPAGVAVHLTAGTFINLNLHLFDEQDSAITGTSGVQVKTVSASEVVNEADMVFSGTFSIDIPSDGQQHNVSGGLPCATTQWHVFDLWPHEHQLGVNQSWSINGSAVMNEPFTFGNQVIYPETDIVVNPGDQIQTTCTYMLPQANCTYTTANGGCIAGSGSAGPQTCGCSVGTCQSDSMCHVQFGEYTQDEMCFTGMYKYPPSGADSTFSCASGTP